MNLPGSIKKTVAFLGIKKDGRFLPRATAFFMHYYDSQFKFDHLVTAEHVVSGLLTKGYEIWLRVNLTNGESTEINIDASSFVFHPDSELTPTDVAVCPFNKTYVSKQAGSPVDFQTIGLNGDGSFIAETEWNDRHAGLGTEVAIVGLFRSHYGQKHNVPIIRVGNIASLPNEPVFTSYAGYIDAYLVEARSIAGLSGSPVFVVPNPVTVSLPQVSALLGLMHGHFDVRNLNEDVVVEDENEVTGGIHTGIGVVIPAKKILETVEHPDLVEKRKEIVANLKAKSGATADLADEIGVALEPPTTEDNPTHEEDFRRLVSAAAKKTEPDA
jgi:hypothetical protein